MDIEVSADGSTFERIGRRRRGRETVDLAWVNGHPQFLFDDLAFSVASRRTRRERRAHRADAKSAPWAVSEVLLHPVGVAHGATAAEGDAGVCTAISARASSPLAAPDGRSYKAAPVPEAPGAPYRSRCRIR